MTDMSPTPRRGETTSEEDGGNIVTTVAAAVIIAGSFARHDVALTLGVAVFLASLLPFLFRDLKRSLYGREVKARTAAHLATDGRSDLTALKTRYAQGEVSDAEFEREVGRLFAEEYGVDPSDPRPPAEQDSEEFERR